MVSLLVYADVLERFLYSRMMMLLNVLVCVNHKCIKCCTTNFLSKSQCSKIGSSDVGKIRDLTCECSGHQICKIEYLIFHRKTKDAFVQIMSYRTLQNGTCYLT